MMKRLSALAIVFALVVCPSMGVAATLVQSATKVSTSASSATPAITLTGVSVGSKVIAYISLLVFNDPSFDWTFGTPTDSGLNTYTIRVQQFNLATNLRSGVAVAYADVTTGGDLTISFNLSNAGGTNNRYFEIGMEEWDDVGAEDTWDGNAVSGKNNAGPITTTDAGDLIVGVAGTSSSDTTMNWASPTSWTNSYRQNNAQATIGIDAGYWEPGSTQTNYTAQWNHDNSPVAEGGGVVVAFLPSATPSAMTRRRAF